MVSEVYWEEGNEVRRIKGEIVEENDNFIVVKTTVRIFKINKEKIIKIIEVVNDE